VRDRREEILARLEAIIAVVPGAIKTARNVEDVSGGAAYRPAIILHDATEEPLEMPNRPRGATKNLVILKPQIFILWGDKARLVATKVNEVRRSLINLVWTDSILREIIGSSRDADIKYGGCGLDTYTGESREAKMLVNFDFIYLLDAEELV
jgi:hypothetical protein